MLKITDQTKECDDGILKIRDLDTVNRVVIHRIAESLGLYAAAIAKSFKDTSTPTSAGSYTGGEMPYTFVIGKDGHVEQALEIGEIGPHARMWNRVGIGVACIGDFRKAPPTPEQYAALVDLCTLLGWWLGGINLVGHTDLKDASSDPKKECPGRFLSVQKLAVDVRNNQRKMAQDLLKLLGVVF